MTNKEFSVEQLIIQSLVKKLIETFSVLSFLYNFDALIIDIRYEYLNFLVQEELYVQDSQDSRKFV